MQKALEIIEEVKKAVVGKNAVIGKMLMVILAQGHILLEDIPGVGKTTLALAFSKAMALDYRRMQFTPDVMPTDVTGFSVYNKSTGQLEYKPGAALCNLFLADEINRTSSKTQAALLEVMEEGRITVDGVTRETPQAIYRDCHAESCRICGYTASSRIPDGSLYGMPDDGVPQIGR